MSIFQNLISSIKGGALGSRYFRTKDLDNLPQDINEAVESVMSKSGEVSALVYAENLFNLIEGLNDKQFISFFNTLSEKYDIDSDSLSKASIEYSKNKTQENLEKITQSSEPEWVELFRRLNTVPEGTLKLVKLRERIRLLEKESPKLAFFDAALLNLFKHWFNPSFLVLKRIDWSTPASILEKIIAYEAVHEINSWSDLRSRLEPEDRRCFAFFHKNNLDIETKDLYQTFNMGVGLVFIVEQSEKDRLISLIGKNSCSEIGVVVNDSVNVVHLYG